MQAISNFLSGSSPAVYIFIFFGKLLEVALATLRAQLIYKGQRVPGALIAILEYTFWLCITASALAGFASDPIKIVILVVAFAVGNVLGSVLEEKQALGYCSVDAVFTDKGAAHEAAELLRAKGHALTLLPAEGICGAERCALFATVQRRNVDAVKALLFKADPGVVITVQDIQQIRGGTIARKRK